MVVENTSLARCASFSYTSSSVDIDNKKLMVFVITNFCSKIKCTLKGDRVNNILIKKCIRCFPHSYSFTVPSIIKQLNS